MALPSMIVEIFDLQEKLAEDALLIRRQLHLARPVVAETVYFHPSREELLLSCWPTTTKEAMQRFVEPLRTLPYRLSAVSMDELTESPHWEGYVKVAESPVLRGLGVHLGLLPGSLFGAIPYDQPTPFKSMLVGGLLGAGLGYGGGWAADMIGDRLGKPGLTLRKKLPWLLGALGAAPGGMLALSNAAAGLPLNDARMLPKTAEAGGSDYVADYVDNTSLAPVVREVRTLLEKHLLGREPSPSLPVTKEAWENLGGGGGLAQLPPVDTTAFGQVVWGDPRVAGRLSAADQTALGTVVYGAANMPYLSRGMAPPSEPSWIPPIAHPTNMAKVLMGYGAGRLSAGMGAMALSSLFNLEPKTQETLKNVGGFAGALQQVARIALQP